MRDATISGDTLKGRTQYRLQIENDTEDVFRQMNWRLQTPYPVEAISFSRSEKCVDPRLVDDQPWVFEGGGSAKVQGRPMSRLKRVFIAELEPKGVVSSSRAGGAGWLVSQRDRQQTASHAHRTVSGRRPALNQTGRKI